MEWWNDLRMLCVQYFVASDALERSGPVVVRRCSCCLCGGLAANLYACLISYILNKIMILLVVSYIEYITLIFYMSDCRYLIRSI
jgi:hypothetical protein